jgi:hypothetical protein
MKNARCCSHFFQLIIMISLGLNYCAFGQQKVTNLHTKQSTTAVVDSLRKNSTSSVVQLKTLIDNSNKKNDVSNQTVLTEEPMNVNNMKLLPTTPAVNSTILNNSKLVSTTEVHKTEKDSRMLIQTTISEVQLKALADTINKKNDVSNQTMLTEGPLNVNNMKLLPTTPSVNSTILNNSKLVSTTGVYKTEKDSTTLMQTTIPTTNTQKKVK